MNKSQIISVIGDAREKRAHIKRQIAESNLDSFCVSLNIPGYPKSTDLYKTFFDVVLSEIKRYFLANRIFIDQKRVLKITDEAGCFYIAPIIKSNTDILQIKELCEQFEEKHLVGRIIDIDITDKHNNPVSSGKAKKCVFCNEKPAFVCMHEESHSYKEVRSLINSKINNYLAKKKKEEVCRKLSALALKSILYEVSVTPKPGLVDRNDSGIHTDMGFYTFLNSGSIISAFFNKIALIGYKYKEEDISKALPIIREIGLEMENEMFNETGKVNTQKGIIFLIGLSLFSSSKTIADFGCFKAEEFQRILIELTKSLINDNTPESEDKTHGEMCKEKYGEQFGGGVKQEAMTGFETVFKYGLPEIRRHNLIGLSTDKEIDSALVFTLLAIISQNNDTNILYRSDLETLKEFKTKAFAALNSIKINNDFSEYNKLIEYCNKNNISPGGSADLLAVTVFLYFTESNFA